MDQFKSIDNDLVSILGGKSRGALRVIVVLVGIPDKFLNNTTNPNSRAYAGHDTSVSVEFLNPAGPGVGLNVKVS